MSEVTNLAAPGGRTKTRYYYKHMGDLKHRLAEALPREELRELHQVRPVRHFLTVARLLAMVLLCGWALWQTEWKWLWAPAAIVQGFNILGFIILLHEQVHKIIFAKSRPRLERLLGLLYAMPSNISATQFSIWHLDHHNELGHAEDDPKRAHLSPKKNTRWTKLLYMTPALFVTYIKGAAKEVATYPADKQKVIRRERLLNLAFHLTLAGTILYLGGGWTMFRVWAVPLFFCFPPAFVLNRLGQHYDIDTTDPAKWTTLVNGNPVWHFLFLWSNFHAEHHYYQRVPFYNLRQLNRKLQPFYERTGLRNRTYREMLYGWFVLNKEAHTDWEMPERSEPASGESAQQVAS
ncbi:MAG TPA: fatty acid desaturase [Thermoanaerobaculia bacterium]|nr:fatty acid desaturase [Thermoanaerobaculia bacterium]